MKIIAYESAEAPAHLRWLARFLEGSYLQPVGFFGKTEEEARTKARVFWDNEQAKIIAKGVKRQTPRKPSAPAIEDVDVV